MKKRTFHIGLPLVSAALVIALAGCSTAGSDASDPGDTAAPGSVDVAAAVASLQPIIDAPTSFPVTEPLETSVTGTNVAFIDCGTPTCALFVMLAEPAAAALGMSSTVIQSGMSPDGVANALDTVIAGGYDGVFVSGLPFPLWQTKADELAANGIAIATTGITGQNASVGASIGSDQQSDRAGSFLADWVIADADGAVDSVIYQTPELPFTLAIADSYTSRIAELCGECAVRVVDIPATQIGTASGLIIDDLSAHPETKAAVFAIGEQALGLPQALKTAGIDDVATIANGPAPAQLADVQNGDLDAALAADWAVMIWTTMDSLARLMTDQAISQGAVDDLVVQQLVTSDNLEGDMSKGWSGYPDFAERFTTLWSNAS